MSRGNSVLGVVFSHMMPKMDFHYSLPKFINIVRQFHDGMQASVRDNGETLKPFPVINGVKQGCVLAPTLFSMYFTAMLRDAFCVNLHRKIDENPRRNLTF